MAGEKILARSRDQVVPGATVTWVDWCLTSAITGPDGVDYLSGADSITIGASDDWQTIVKKIRDGIAARITQVTGQAFTAADVKGFQSIRTGTISVALLDTSKAVTFSSPMPSSSYRLTFQSQGLIAVNLGYSSKTTDGFTLNLSLGVNATIDYVAVED